jgi:hypothetical protein
MQTSPTSEDDCGILKHLTIKNVLWIFTAATKMSLVDILTYPFRNSPHKKSEQLGPLENFLRKFHCIYFLLI